MATAIALSGGIDSLISAFLLKQRNEEVIGIHFLTGYEAIKHPRTDGPSVHPVVRMAEQIGVDVHIFDIRNTFKNEVIDYFISTYASGRTPNPCMVCNKRIKFGIMRKEAKRLGADRIATGHYACISGGGERYGLMKGNDEKKDQSYFLAMLTQEQLADIIFPLCGAKKQAVRSLAADKGLKPAAKNESQDICFINDGSYRSFLEPHLKHLSESGDIVDSSGNVIGEHKGLFRYTVGQRRGINCPAAAPYYVLRLDTRKNRLVVGSRDELYQGRCYVSGVNWMIPEPDAPLHVATRLRYRHNAVDSTIVSLDGGRARIEFKKPQPAVTPGQAAVCYQKDRVVAGGWIEGSVFR